MGFTTSIVSISASIRRRWWGHTSAPAHYRRLIDHSHSSNIHAHIGAPPPTAEYPYWVHTTGDIRQATLKVGDTLIYDRGYLTALDNPAVKAVAAKYPGRPGLGPQPRHF
jgi:hypothetical protein